MRVVEPDNTAGVVEEIGMDPPEFPVVVRGYGRRRVNAYLQSMVSRLAAEHDRAAQAEDDARDMIEEAQSASQRMWEKVRGERTVMQAETERLQTLRDRTMQHLSRVQTDLDSLILRPPEDESDAPSVRDVAAGGDADSDFDLEATAETGPEPDPPAESSEPAEPDAAAAVQLESDQEDDSEPARPATTPASAQRSARSR